MAIKLHCLKISCIFYLNGPNWEILTEKAEVNYEGRNSKCWSRKAIIAADR